MDNVKLSNSFDKDRKLELNLEGRINKISDKKDLDKSEICKNFQGEIIGLNRCTKTLKLTESEFFDS